MGRHPLSEAEQLLLDQSEELDGLFFDIDDPDPDSPTALIPDDRPRSRSDCVKGPRPCPWVTCRHHLMTDVRADGILRVNFPGGPETMLATCSIDLANEGPRTLEQIAVLMGMSRERVRQLEERSLVKLRFAIREGDLDYEGSAMEKLDGAEVMEEVHARHRREEAAEALAERRAAEEAERKAAKRRRRAKRAARRRGTVRP